MKHSSSLFPGALWAEAVKVLRSKILWVSLAAAAALPIMFGLVLAGIIATNVPVPVGVGFNEYAKQLGLLMAVGGLIGFGFIFSWLFGREYADGTITDLLALPVARGTIVAAKFTIGIVWCALLAAAVFSTGTITAGAVGMAGLTPGAVKGVSAHFAVTTSMAMAVSLPVARAASTDGGYLSPLGFVIVTLAAGQFGVVFGFGQWVPWAIPALYTGAPGYEGPALMSLNFLLPYVVGIVGIFLTGHRWCCTDQP